ncbi:hypothetical protein GCM10027429_05830 [Marivirga atlantica]|jgi:sensor histidine kinase YesM|uniref:Histidine kinase n=1 Tax=Marivirga atlantica TaxID=1548457 RepID=A0A937DFY4_9BACT|nr:histidine kinase [Marivirga atlantica]MBL0764193.1 histidine kinase [Marivirga atlantica]
MKVEEIPWYDFVNFGFAGAMLLVFVYALSVYFYDSKAIYLYYAIYIFTVGLYLFSRSTLIYVNIIQDIEFFFPRITKLLTHTFQYVAHFAALQFGILFLNAKKDYPKFYRAAYYTRILFLVAIALSLINIITYNNSQFYYWLINIERLIGTVMAIYFQVTVLKNSKNKLAVFYVIGSIVFLIGAIISVFALNVVYMRIGTLIEIIIFTLGLAYRSKIIQDERNLFRERMMSETYEKEKLLEQYNEDLKKQVLQRSEALLKEQQTVEEEKQKVMRLSLEKEVDQMKMKALRAQMKPHFLFNALNAIRAMIIKENPHQAYDYLTDFSRLVRYILESSEHNYVSLAEELKMIDIYVRIEQMRGSENFVFEKNIDSDINLSQVEIPPLIFQPFLENSIVHAFDQSTPEQLLELNINQVEDQLKVVVIDNGKGRSMEKTAVIHEGKNKSMATDLTRQRLELLNFQKSSLQIIDLKDDYDKPSGTQVILNLPIIINGKKIKSTIS